MIKPNKPKSIPSVESDLQLEIVSWNQVYGSLFVIADLIKNSGFAADVIVGVSRGGWVPARVLSDLLENSNLVNVATNFYVGVNKTKQEPKITQELSGSVSGKKVLVVDDLVDSGKSLKLVISHLKSKGVSEVKTVTLFHKPQSLIVPDYYIEETACWVVFPWDHKETVRMLFDKYKTLGKSNAETKEKLISFGLNKIIINQISEEKH